MSDTDRLNLRDLPAVDPVPLPQRFSQTLLNKADRCRRSAYLYMKHGGGTPAVQLDFGIAYHLFAERALNDMIAAEEPTLYAVAEGEDPKMAQRAVASLTAAMCDEILTEHRELTLPARGTHSRDALRQLAYHFAIGSDINPLTDVLAVEQKFVLDLDCGWTVSGKVDVCTVAGDPRVGGVDDWKTTFNVPTQDQFEDLFQLRLYALLYVFGEPVEKVPCPAGCHAAPPVCGECHGVGSIERRLPPLGSDFQWIRCRELYPRYLRDDGTIRNRAMVLSRQEIADFRHDVEALAVDLAERLETWKFPAIGGSHCNECPCEPECPLPEHLRDHAGAINDMKQAAEAAEWAERTDDRVKATWREVKNFANVNGPVRYGRDKVREFTPAEKWKTDWDALEVAIERARLYGEPFELSLYRQPQVSTSFRSRKLSAAELEPEQPEVSLDERFGAEPPF